MKLVSIGIAAASVVTGLAGAGVAFELATVDSPGTSAAAPAAQTEQRKVDRRVRWKPCQSPAVREGRACVTEEVRLVPIGGATSASNVAVVRRSHGDDAHDAFDDHGGDRDDSFDDDDHFDDHDDFDDDDSGHRGDGYFDDDRDDDWDDDWDDDDGDRDDDDDDDDDDRDDDDDDGDD